jgi:DDE superfamily endonuclease
MAPKGVNDVYYVQRSSEKRALTLLATVAANGSSLPPFLVYPYKKMPKTIPDSIPTNWRYSCSPSGWMTNEGFLQYLQQHFIPSLKDQGTKFPVLLTLDGASSHISYEIHGNENFLIVFSNFNYDV